MNDATLTTNFEALAGGSRPLQVNREGVVRIKSPRGLAVNSLLRKDEWEALDAAVIEAARYPLRAVADLRARGLVTRLGGLGTLVSEWNTSSQMTAANVNMTGQSRGEADRVEYSLAGVPVPVVFKEFQIGVRQLEAARRLGNALDTTHAYEASRVVAEKMESMLIDGESISFNGSVLYGYTNHPSRNTDTATNYGGGDWGTLSNIVPTVAGMINAAQGDYMYGPYMVYVYTTQFNQAANTFYTDGSGQTGLQRVKQLPGVLDCVMLPTLADGEVVLVQMTRNVVDWAEAMDIQVVEWASGDGMTGHFKVMAVAAPRVKADYVSTRCGIVHATSA